LEKENKELNMNKKTLSLVLVAALAFGASAASAYTTAPTPPPGHPAGHGWIQLSAYDYMTTGPYAGNYRYVYDLYNDTSTYLRQANMYFDASGVLNQFNYYNIDRDGDGEADPDLVQNWCTEAAGIPRPNMGFLDTNRWPSYWVTKPDFTQAWVEPKDIIRVTDQSYMYSPDARIDPLPVNTEWYMDNEWHTGGQYVGGGIFTFKRGYADETGIYWDSDNNLLTPDRFSAGLAMTFVIYHPSAVGSYNIQFGINQGVSGWVDGPMVVEENDPGDFDGDGDVDVDDINALCANMTGDGIPLPPGFEQYDLDNDGDADSADMDILIHGLVETTVGIGTEYGDFNLDGKIDTVDLTILGTYFGVGTSWSQGNANCDTTVDTVDLTILGTYFGFVASSPIPEPATMSLLAIGGIAALIRRRK